MPRLSAIAIACTALLAAVPAVAAPPLATDLGRNNAVQSVSDDGAVVVGLALNYDDPQSTGVTRWTAGSGTQLIGGLSVGRPTVSANGSTIAATVMTDRQESAFWTTADGWRPLGTLELIPPLPGWTTVSHAISGNGQRLAGETVPPPVDYGRGRAFSFNPDTFEDRWADYGWQELPLGRKGSMATASGISDDGLIQVGGATDSGGAFRAVRWNDGRITELLDGQRRRLGGESVRCSRNCKVIVGGGGGSSSVTPVLAWRILPIRSAPACYLAPLSGPALPALRYYAFDTSDSGDVVTGSYFYTELSEDGFIRSVAKGFLWIGNSKGGTMHDLQTYLHGLGQPFLDGWLSVRATGLSADGRYLVGHGEDAQGVTRGWRIAFDGVPQATGPAADRTLCPIAGQASTAVEGASADDQAPLHARYYDSPSGEFRGAGARPYVVQTRGGRVHGGIRRDRLAELLWIGGDQYYDPATRSRRTFQRDRNGLVIGMAERTAGRATLQLRRTGD